MFQMINEFSSILKSFTAGFAMERTLVLLVRFDMALIMMFRSQLGRTLWTWVEVMTASSDAGVDILQEEGPFRKGIFGVLRGRISSF